MNKSLVIGLGLTALWIFVFAWITTNYESNVADQYESAEPRPMPIQRYHDTNMDGGK